MTIGVIVGGVVEEAKLDIAYGIYKWHKTGDWRQAIGGAKAGAATIISAEVARRAAIRWGLKTIARAIPYVGIAVWA